MRKILLLLLAGLLVIGLVGLVGCGEKKTAVKTEEGEVEVTEKDGEVEVTEEGETTTWSEDVSEKDLGVPIYPGAKLQEGSAGKVETEGEEGKTSMSAAVLETKDPAEKVIAWYKDKLSGKPGFTDTSMVTGDELVGMFTFTSGDESKMVMISSTDGMTGISITTQTGMPGITE